ncbi:MAG TPA: DUF1707 domain-containing protein [Streptosporangiaceae bacterium]
MTGELEPAGGGELVPPGELRASYADRDRVAEQLRIAAGDGRLDAEELDQRLEKALTARTYAELTALTRDLPAVGGTAGPPRELIRIDTGSGSAERSGRWVVPRRMEVRVRSGSTRLDFTEAVITQPTLEIEAEVRSGALVLITKPGITVDLDDVSVRSGVVKDRTQWSPSAPAILHIRVSGQVGSGEVAVRAPRPPRRTFWQWLLRRPRPRAPYQLT